VKFLSARPRAIDLVRTLIGYNLNAVTFVDI